MDADLAIHLIEKAEAAIQKILLDLTNEHGFTIEHVNVDTRNFGNLATEIHYKAPQPKEKS